jgi:L-2-hydroxycarboxylate dehydrogenase (NAD+)
MQIAISDITEKMTSVLKAKGYDEANIPFIIDMFLGGELQGHVTHGLAGFADFIQADFSACEEPVVIKDTAAFFLLDAKGNPGNVLGRRIADEAISRAKTQVTGTAMIKDMDGWLRPGAIAEYIAKQGFMTVVINNGGGSAITPPGGFDPVVGTNPIAYGIPAEDGPLVVDMATAKRAWGQVRLANKYDTELPGDTYYDNEGNITLDPKKAWSVKSFGEYKGFSLALMIEIMCGSLLGMDMMVTSDSGSKFGQKMPTHNGFIIVIDPEQTVGLENFKKANSELLHDIKTTRPLPNQDVRIPGEHAATQQAAKQASNTIEIPDELWEEIRNL